MMVRLAFIMLIVAGDLVIMWRGHRPITSHGGRTVESPVTQDSAPCASGPAPPTSEVPQRGLDAPATPRPEGLIGT